MHCSLRRGFALCALGLSLLLLADGPTDNQPDQVRRVPPPGIALSDSQKRDLELVLAELEQDLAAARVELEKKPALLSLMPDVEVFTKAAGDALRYGEFFKTNEVREAHEAMMQARDRLAQLRQGRAPWTNATGLVVRGYRSVIDGSVQPYGLVVPNVAVTPWRLDFWFHGRGETLSELAFVTQRMRGPGEFTPPKAIVLHLYGRYCNANRFAGESDLFEALEHVKRYYPIDENRIAVRGFSMGGAACWQFATHHAWRWAAAAPGAGFSETADFLKVFQQEKLQPSWWEQKLWRWYDSTDYAANLIHLPLVAYSGEIDRQKQAADLMAAAMRTNGLDMVHLIGPKTGHSYHAETKAELNHRIDRIMDRGRDPVPRKVSLTTFTLQYPRMFWVRAEGLGQHWERARIDAELQPERNGVEVKTSNVSGLSLEFEPGLCPLDPRTKVRVRLDGRDLEVAGPRSDRSWKARFWKSGSRWSEAREEVAGNWITLDAKSSRELAPALRKRPGLQGPIDDAFMGSFLMVGPGGSSAHAGFDAWVSKEMEHARDHWRRQFRGEARFKKDSEVTDADIAAHHLVLWGDPESNAVLKRVADRLPVSWSQETIVVGGRKFEAARSAVAMIFPNPLNPTRYLVLNSGFTFREYDYLNNARQTAKLPDWAVLDISKPVTSRAPGGIAEAGFFDEFWKVKTR